MYECDFVEKVCKVVCPGEKYVKLRKVYKLVVEKFTSTNTARDAIALSDIRIVLEIGSGLGQDAIEKLIGQMVSVAQQHP